jgi:endonuclease G
LETCVICGPIFYFDKPVKFIGLDDGNEVALPVPNAFFKSVLTESNTGRLQMWSFILPNKKSTKPIEDFRVATTKVERYAGIQLWSRLEGAKIDSEKKKIRKLW